MDAGPDFAPLGRGIRVIEGGEQGIGFDVKADPAFPEGVEKPEINIGQFVVVEGRLVDRVFQEEIIDVG